MKVGSIVKINAYFNNSWNVSYIYGFISEVYIQPSLISVPIMKCSAFSSNKNTGYWTQDFLSVIYEPCELVERLYK